MFFNWLPQDDIAPGPAREGAYENISLALPGARQIMPFPWTFVGAALRIAASTLGPLEDCVFSLANGGIPISSVTVKGPYAVPTVFMFPGLPIGGPAGAALSWQAINTGTGVVTAPTICALWRRTGQVAPTRGLMSWQPLLHVPSTSNRGMFTAQVVVPASLEYMRLALPFAGTLTGYVQGVAINPFANPTLLSYEKNGVVIPAPSLFIPAGFTGVQYGGPPAVPAGFVAGDVVTFAGDWLTEPPGPSLEASAGMQFEFPV